MKRRTDSASPRSMVPPRFITTRSDFLRRCHWILMFSPRNWGLGERCYGRAVSTIRHERTEQEELCRSHRLLFGTTLRPLIELLRIKYAPTRHDFYTRYVYYDLPQAVNTESEALFYVAKPRDLRIKHRRAGNWFRSLMNETSTEKKGRRTGPSTRKG